MRTVTVKNRKESTGTEMAQRAAALKFARGEFTTDEEKALAMDFLRARGATTVRSARQSG